MSNEILILLAVLATYRLTRLFVYDDGPRNYILQWRVSLDPESQMGKFVKCPFCVGIWVAAFIAILVFLPWIISNPLLLWLGLAGGQEFLEVHSGHRG